MELFITLYFCTKYPVPKFYLNFFLLLVDFLQSLPVSVASSWQDIIKMKFILNASNITCWLWAGLCCLHINSFAYIFVAYVSTYLFFAHILLLATEEEKHNSETKHEIKNIVLFIWSNENFKGAHSCLRQVLVIKSLLKLTKNAFYFTSKERKYVLKIFKFLSWLFGHVVKRLD